jgi:hypothetical protein
MIVKGIVKTMLLTHIESQVLANAGQTNWARTLQTQQAQIHQLPNYVRSIRTENLKALSRRWNLARSTELIDSRVLSRWFPGQRGLLEMLAVMSEEEVARVAACNSPIFSLTLHEGINPATSASLGQPGEFEAANRHEAFMALMTRRENVIECTDQASVQYDLSSADVKVLSKYESHELWDLSANPSLVLQPVASDQWFMVAAVRDLTVAQRTLYLGMSKRPKASIH